MSYDGLCLLVLKAMDGSMVQSKGCMVMFSYVTLMYIFFSYLPFDNNCSSMFRVVIWFIEKGPGVVPLCRRMRRSLYHSFL